MHSLKITRATLCLAAVFLSTASCKQRDASPQAIYGNDDRTSPHKHNDPTLKELASAIVLLTTETSTPVANDGFCSGAIFETEAKKFLLTAGHCLKTQEQCNDTRLVFNYEDDVLPQQQVIVKCEQLMFTKNNPDFAIATFSSPVYGKFDSKRLNAIPLQFSNHHVGSPLAVIGHRSSQWRTQKNCRSL